MPDDDERRRRLARAAEDVSRGVFDAIGDGEPDDSEMTDAELAELRPFAEVLPEIRAVIKRGPGRPKLDAPKVQVSLRLDPDVLEKWRSTGAGWQGRVNAALCAAKV